MILGRQRWRARGSDSAAEDFIPACHWHGCATGASASAVRAPFILQVPSQWQLAARPDRGRGGLRLSGSHITQATATVPPASAPASPGYDDQ